MTALTRETRRQSIEEMFVQHIENIYYPGFTEEMTEEQSALYDWEFKEFQKNFRMENEHDRQSQTACFFYGRTAFSLFRHRQRKRLAKRNPDENGHLFEKKLQKASALLLEIIAKIPM